MKQTKESKSKETKEKKTQESPKANKPQVSSKGMYYYIKQAWKKPNQKVLRERMIEWRKSPAFTRVEKPLRLDKARGLGYKDKKGFVIIRVRLMRGAHKRSRPNKGRRGKRLHTRKNLRMNYQEIAEHRTARKFRNLEVLNSYYLGKDGIYYFFEIILVDPERPEIKDDPTISWIARPENRGRTFRGLTLSGKKSRGLRKKSRETKNRPSLRSNKRLGK